MEIKTRNKQVVWGDLKEFNAGFPDKITYTNKEAVKNIVEHVHKGIKMKNDSKGFLCYLSGKKNGREANKMLLCLKYWED